MLHASTRKLIDRLAEMTELGKLDWTEGDGDSVTYSTEGYSVSLTLDPNELIITSKDGKELERASSEELANTPTEEGGRYTDIMAAMTSEAVRLARGTEAAISSLLAGMDEPTVSEEPVSDEPASEDTALVDHPEDPIDESSALAPEPSNQPDEKRESETETETTTEAIEATTDSAEETNDAAPIAASDDDVSEPDDSSDVDAAAEDEVPAAESARAETDSVTDAEPEAANAETETESDVTEAVARMANEVNQREDDGLTTGLPGAAALAAQVADETEPAPEATDSNTETEPETETNISEAYAEPEDAPVVAKTDDDPIANGAFTTPENSTYVPFGLEPDAPISAAVAALANPSDAFETPEPATMTEDPAEPAATGFDAVAESGPTLETPDTPTEPAAELAPEPAPDTFATITPVTESSVVTDAPEAEESASESEAEALSETALPPIVGAPLETASDAAPSSDAVASEPVETPDEPEVLATNLDPVSEPSEFAPEIDAQEPVEDVSTPEPEPVLATLTPEPDVVPTPANLDEETVAPEPVSSPPQTYSLSGIGAGFGLGALAAKTEASGIPGPSGSATSEPEKIVIDATDDVLPEIEGNINLPLVEKATSAVKAAAAESASSEENDAEDSDVLKPRTRFNPWD